MYGRVKRAFPRAVMWMVCVWGERRVRASATFRTRARTAPPRSALVRPTARRESELSLPVA